MLKYLTIIILLIPLPAPGSVGISGLDVSPDPFSPNGNGVRDSTVVSFTLETDEDAAFVWITVTDSEDETVIRLAEAESNQPGVIEKVWLGQTSTGDPALDGIYTFEVKARAGPDSTPVFARSVFLDTTAPSIEDVRPHPSPYAPKAPMGDSLLTVDIAITGSNEGDWLSAIMMIPDDPETLCTFGLSAADSTYTCSWDGRERDDGVYALKVTTFDTAGNSAFSSHSVDLDLEGPELTIDFPEEAAMDTFPHEVRGTFWDRNDVAWTVFRFHENMNYLDVTVPDPAPCCPIPWSVEWPDSLKYDRQFNLEINAADTPGYESTTTHQVVIKSEASDAPTISPVPERVSDPEITITGTCGAGDSLFAYLNGALHARTSCSESGTFTAGLTLALGINEIYAVSRDVAGHDSDPSETVSVEYTEQMGIRVDERLDGPAVIEINLPKEAGRVVLRVYSLSGTYVRTVVEDSPEQFDEMEWDLTDTDGRPVRNGPYVLAFEINYADGTTSIDKKAVVVAR